MQTHTLRYRGPAPRPAAGLLTREGLESLAVDGAITLARAIGTIMSVLDALFRPLRTAAAAASLAALRIPPRVGLKELWAARAVREAFRLLSAAGLERAVLRRVVVRGNTAALGTPSVLAIYHTPWGRLLARWIAGRGSVVLLAAAHWSRRAPGAHTPSNRAGMRALLRQLRSGRSAAVTIDHFSEGGRVVRECCVLNVPVTACTGAARLAAAAGVPVVPVSFRWTGHTLEVHLGHRFTVSRETVCVATAALVAEFDRAVRADLSSWANAHRFLSS